jgi:hypothetical protein
VGAKEIVAKVAAEVKVSPGLEGEAEDLWSAARLGALTVYLGPVEKITALGAEDLRVLFHILEGWVSVLKIRLSEGWPRES